jgi:hypothetical protein
MIPRESGQTSDPGGSSRESPKNYPEEGRQMTAVETQAGAPSSREIGAVAAGHYREVVKGIGQGARRVLPKGVRSCLSRVTGNCHARF